MQQYTLDGSLMTTLEAAYAEIAHGLALPAYFGENLDALEECLAELTGETNTIEVVIHHASVLRELPEWPAIESVFHDNPHITLTLVN